MVCNDSLPPPSHENSGRILDWSGLVGNVEMAGANCSFLLPPGPVYWDLTIAMFVFQLRNIVYDTP